MTVVFERKLLKVGGSLGITLPKSVLDTYNMKKGDTVAVVSGVIDNYLLVNLTKKTNKEVFEDVQNIDF